MVESRICVGVVAGAHGVRGLVRVKSFTEEPSDIAAYGQLSDAEGRRHFELEITGSAKGVLLARIDGIRDREAAEALRGVEFYVARDALPAPAEEEFYHADLIGLPAVLADGSSYGTVRALHEFGAGDMIEILLEDGGVSVLPFTRAVVPVVDVDGGRIVIAPPTETEAREDSASEDGT
ncbi:MAG: 16S rRNA processing protein RimM [Alphaproteobacteria bacterium]|nr:16S rRNA processing protein RimM [Alphaproteobacteria bacterium]